MATNHTDARQSGGGAEVERLYRDISVEARYGHYVRIPERICRCLDYFGVRHERAAVAERLRRFGGGGRLSENVCLLQADLSDLPFRPASFQTVLCMNVLHQFADADGLIPKLDALLAPGGRLHLTSLVSNRRFIGDRYLDALHRAGEFVRPRRSFEFEKLLRGTLSRGMSYDTRGNMAFATSERRTPA